MQKKLTKKQEKNLKNKFVPLKDKTYLLTDQCFWEVNPPEDYNVHDPKRKPHAVTLVDQESGSVVILKSGSIIKIIKAI